MSKNKLLYNLKPLIQYIYKCRKKGDIKKEKGFYIPS